MHAICIGYRACNAIGDVDVAAQQQHGQQPPQNAFPGGSYQGGLLITALHHAREPIGANAALRFAADVANRVLAGDASTLSLLSRLGGGVWIVPCANPDSYALNLATLTWGDPGADRGGLARRDTIMARKNRRPGCPVSEQTPSTESVGVDTNRNYDFYWDVDEVGSNSQPCAEDFRGPAAFSEPETSAVARLVESTTLSVALNLHSYGRFINLPYCVQRLGSPPEAYYAVFLQLAEHLAGVSGFGYGHPWSGGLYSVNGEASDWMFARHGVFAMSPEVGPYMEFNPFEEGMWPKAADVPALTAETAALLEGAARIAGPLPLLSLGPNATPAQAPAADGQGQAVTVEVVLQNGGAVDFQGSVVVAVLPLEDALIAWPADLFSAAAPGASGSGWGLNSAAAAQLSSAVSTTWQELLQLRKAPSVCLSQGLPALPADAAWLQAQGQPARRRARQLAGSAAAAAGGETAGEDEKGEGAEAPALPLQEGRARQLARLLKSLPHAALEAAAAQRNVGSSASAASASVNTYGSPLSGKLDIRALAAASVAFTTSASASAADDGAAAAAGMAGDPSSDVAARRLIEAAPHPELSGAGAATTVARAGARYSILALHPQQHSFPQPDAKLTNALPPAPPAALGSASGAVTLPPTFKTPPLRLTFASASSAGLPTMAVQLPHVPLSADAQRKREAEGKTPQAAEALLQGAVLVSDDLLCWVYGVTAAGGLTEYPLLTLQSACSPCAALRAGKDTWGAIAQQMLELQPLPVPPAGASGGDASNPTATAAPVAPTSASSSVAVDSNDWTAGGAAAGTAGESGAAAGNALPSPAAVSSASSDSSWPWASGASSPHPLLQFMFVGLGIGIAAFAVARAVRVLPPRWRPGGAAGASAADAEGLPAGFEGVAASDDVDSEPPVHVAAGQPAQSFGGRGGATGTLQAVNPLSARRSGGAWEGGAVPGLLKAAAATSRDLVRRMRGKGKGSGSTTARAVGAASRARYAAVEAQVFDDSGDEEGDEGDGGGMYEEGVYAVQGPYRDHVVGGDLGDEESSASNESSAAGEGSDTVAIDTHTAAAAAGAAAQRHTQPQPGRGVRRDVLADFDDEEDEEEDGGDVGVAVAPKPSG
jgi:hypothetical protein